MRKGVRFLPPAESAAAQTSPVSPLWIFSTMGTERTRSQEATFLFSFPLLDLMASPLSRAGRQAFRRRAPLFPFFLTARRDPYFLFSLRKVSGTPPFPLEIKTLSPFLFFCVVTSAVLVPSFFFILEKNFTFSVYPVKNHSSV